MKNKIESILKTIFKSLEALISELSKVEWKSSRTWWIRGGKYPKPKYCYTILQEKPQKIIFSLIMILIKKKMV